MKKKSSSRSAFFNLRVLIGLFIVLAGVFLALAGLGTFSAITASSAQAQQKYKIINVQGLPPGFDCSTIHEKGIDKMENLRAGLIMIACGEAQGGSTSATSTLGPAAQFIQKLLAPLAFGAADVNLITGTETSPHITQSETFTAANPDDPNQVVVAYNDSRSAPSNNISGASVSTDGGTTFTRLTKTNGQSPFANTFGDPVILYNKPTGTWYTAWIDAGCGGGGLGGYKSTTPADPNSWTHYCVHTGSADDRESGWADNNPSSPFFGRMYVSWNDFNRGGGALFVRYSTDNGATWTNERQVTTTFFRDVQITGDLATGDVYIASMNEMGGGLTNRANKMYRSTDGGNTWTNTYTGPTFPGPGRTVCPNTYFACMYPDTGGYWRHMGWGEPAAFNHVVSYVYASRNTANGDPGNVFYIRSTDSGVTFSAPLQLNTDTTTRAQWQPNLSVSPTGTLLAVWYDERESTTCTKGNPAVPCYRMWARKSNDNGLTWLPDDTFSDVVSPLPGQPDPNIIAEYAGDYDYGKAIATKHLSAWVDGRVPIAGASQQNAFTDAEPISGGGGANLVSAASRLTHGTAGAFDINMPLTGTSGVEDRNAAGSFLAVFTFDAPVTSGSAAVVVGTATAGTPTFSGNEMRVPLTSVADIQIVTIEISNVNGGGGTADVNFGFLIGDVNANRTVDRPDLTQIQTDRNQIVNGSNFRDDVNLSGVVDRPDQSTVQANRGHSIP